MHREFSNRDALIRTLARTFCSIVRVQHPTHPWIPFFGYRNRRFIIIIIIIIIILIIIIIIIIIIIVIIIVIIIIISISIIIIIIIINININKEEGWLIVRLKQLNKEKIKWVNFH